MGAGERTRVPPQSIENYVPIGDSIATYAEVLALETIQGVRSPQPPEQIAANLRASIQPRATDGSFQSWVLAGPGTPTIHPPRHGSAVAWSIEGDTLLEDQFEVQWHTSGSDGLRIVRYTARARPTTERLERARRLVLWAQVDWDLHRATLAQTPLPQRLSEDAYRELVNKVSQPLTLPFPPASELYRLVASTVRRDLQPLEWAWSPPRWGFN